MDYNTLTRILLCVWKTYNTLPLGGKNRRLRCLHFHAYGVRLRTVPFGAYTKTADFDLDLDLYLD